MVIEVTYFITFLRMYVFYVSLVISNPERSSKAESYLVGNKPVKGTAKAHGFIRSKYLWKK